MIVTERPVQLHGSAIARGLLRLLGWKLVFDGLPAPQGVLIVYPHTSNWDFPVGMLAKWAMGLQATFWAKDTLFRWPLVGWWMRWVGGLPVDRSAPRGMVGQMVDELRAAREQGRFRWLVVAPEGTRSLGEGWRSGFYHVAREADVPVALAHIDFATRSLGVRRCVRLSGDRDADMAEIADDLAGVRGHRPELAAPIRLK
jgi:1-acyl-sn-glycerol-3-phosphate acyltransferase